MIICKYSRLGSAVYVPHLDLMRAFMMSMRRNKIKISFSEGFSPHMQIYFNQPLPIGTESESEYFCVVCEENAEHFMNTLNQSLPLGIRICKAANVIKNPNFAKIICSAWYEVTLSSPVHELLSIDNILQQGQYMISYNIKGIEQTKDVRPLILDIKPLSESKVMLKFNCGNANLRADRFMTSFLQQNNASHVSFNVIKKQTFDALDKDIDFHFLDSIADVK